LELHHLVGQGADLQQLEAGFLCSLVKGNFLIRRFTVKKNFFSYTIYATLLCMLSLAHELCVVTVSLNDLHQFDLITLQWSQIEQDTEGIAPSSRNSFGFASAGPSLYMFGGRPDTKFGIEPKTYLERVIRFPSQ
jgi:hypothetical protein